MELWRVALDWMLILLSSFYLCVIYNRLIMKPQVSIANYVYLILWAFCCLPILLRFMQLVGQVTRQFTGISLL